LELSANAVLVLIAVACSLLDKQVAGLANQFENEGGFSERLYRIRNMKKI
jgi:four helix bundle suffix protein